MKFSRYFLFTVAAVMFAFAQQSTAYVAESTNDKGNKLETETIRIIEKSSKENLDASISVNATILLKDGYIKLTKNLSTSEDKFLDEISAANKIILEKPAVAKKILQKAFENIRISLFEMGVPIFKSMGIALGLSSDEAKQGLVVANGLIQRAGIAALDSWNDAENLFNQGFETKGAAGELLLQAVRLAVETGYAAAYSNIQESIQVADQAIRDAKTRPGQGYGDEKNCEAVASKDSACSVAIKLINEDANNALRRGANNILVENVFDVFSCSLRNFLNITSAAERTFENITTTPGITPLEARITFFKQIEAVRKGIYALTADLYLLLGNLALKTGNQSNFAIDAAIAAIEHGRFDICLGIATAEDLITLGLGYQDYTKKLAFESAAESGKYAKLAFIQQIVTAAKLAFSVL